MTCNKLTLPAILLIITLSGIACNTLFDRDHSLKPEEYQKLGMPEYNKIWTDNDYIGCNITLSSLKIYDPLSFPRKNSKKSGLVFKRMVSTDNLNFIYDTISPLRLRAYTIQSYPRFQYEMEQMYTIEHKGKVYYDEELIDLHIFGIAVYDKMLELAGIIKRSDDDDVSSIKSGMDVVKYNYLKYIPGIMDELAKKDIYSEEGVNRLSKALSESLHRNIEWMSPADKSSLLTEMKSGSEKVKTDLQECIKLLSN